MEKFNNSKRGLWVLWGVIIGLFLAPLSLWAFGGNEDISVFPESRVVRSSHFVLHYEDPMAPAGVLNTLEGLHSKLLLDLGAFSPWAYRESIHVYLYKDGPSYSSHTGMQPYMVAHVKIQEKTIFGHMGPDFQRVLAHELAHLFFTQYFLEKSTVPPLWLNEGVATLMEWQYGLEADQKAMERQLDSEGTIPFGQFFGYTYVHAGPEDGKNVGLWYNQAQSVTCFLMRGFTQGQFVRLCQRLRDGETLNEALPKIYGMIIPDSSSLERLWREKIASQ